MKTRRRSRRSNSKFRDKESTATRMGSPRREAQRTEKMKTKIHSRGLAELWALACVLLAITSRVVQAAGGMPTANSSDNPKEAMIKAEALVASPQRLTAPNFEVCRLQTRLQGRQLTNLSQIMFQPEDTCSTWHKMQRSPMTLNSNEQQDLQHDEAPWAHIEQLNLSHNNLTVLHDSSGMNRLVQLQELRITHNQLLRCEESALAGLYRLQHLDLSHNRLPALPAKFFQPVSKTLKKLNLSFNSITVLVPGLLDSLSRLESLDLSHNEITSHWINERLFKNLSQLHYLDLSFNKLTVFSSPTTFGSLQQLETLSLQHNELRQVPDTIQHLHYLSSLDLSQNHIHDITNASYLSNCKSLFNLNLESNLLENITRDAFSDLPALKVLNLANNRIHHLDQQAFEYVPDLHALRLDSNRLVDFGSAVVNLRFLLMLNISSNRISSFDYAQIPLGLQWLDLHSNKIDKLNNFYYTTKAQEQYSQSANDISQLAMGGGGGGVATTLREQWQSMLRLTTLDASFNLIRELDNTSLPESLETVQLNNNHIRNIASHTFTTKSNLTRINLSHNQLTQFPLDSLKLYGNRDTQQQTLSSLQTSSMALTSNGGKADGGGDKNRHKFVDIYLANNPFICNCNMGWFSQLLLASSYLSQGSQQQQQHHHQQQQHLLGNNKSTIEASLRDVLWRLLPRVADAHLISCHLPFARHSPFTMGPSHHWWPVMAANQLAAASQLPHHSHLSREPTSSSGSTTQLAATQQPLIQKQSEVLASVHLCPYKSHCFALCTCCEFDACDCEMSCPENCSCYYDQTWSTNVVDCSANQMMNGPSSRPPSGYQHHHSSSGSRPMPVKFLNIPDKIPMDVTELYLDGQELNYLKGNALIGRRNLKILYLNNSQVQSIEPKAFATQKSLRILQLNSNYLKELQGHEFEQQVELRELYLANNQLSSIANGTFAHLRNLQMLHLQNNQLYYLDLWSNLPSGHRLSSLNLGSNPWSCQCDYVDRMLKWLHLNMQHVSDRKSISCQYNQTSALHLLAPASGGVGVSVGGSQQQQQLDIELPIAYDYLNENYPMFDLRMCLNHTVYPTEIITQQLPRTPSPLPRLPGNSVLNPLWGSFEDPLQQQSGNINNSLLQPGAIQPPNDEPFSTLKPAPNGNNPLDDIFLQASNPLQFGLPMDQQQSSPPIYQPAPSSNSRGVNILSNSFLLGATTTIIVAIVLIVSLIHYRHSMGVWFYSRYGLGMIPGGGGKKQHPSLAKHSQLHQHHHPHIHHHQCGASSTGSTSSSSAASSNLSQALCQQQQRSAAVAANQQLVTTPLIVTNNHHQLLSHSATTTATAAANSPYNDEEKLFDAYLTYSKLDEQFVNDFLAPELEYGQPAYRVALHYRDVPATAAKFLTDCIVETANASRKIIMILSEQLLKTEWMQYEFRMAHLEALRSNHRHRLIVIMLGQPSFDQLDADLAQWLKSCTSIQWGEKQFWQRLRFAMPELPFNRQQPQYLRYQTLAPHQTGKQGRNNTTMGLGANLLKSAGGLLGGHHHHHQPPPPMQQQLVTSSSLNQSLGRPLPQPGGLGNPNAGLHIRGAEEHHYAHLTPATMIYNQQQQQTTHTYHQPIYGDPQQQQQQQQCQASRDNPTMPAHI